MDEKKSAPAEKRPAPRQETFPELWDLKEMREARGISLNDLFEKTRISQINLMAVENNDFGRLPPPVYARNFIRKYARAVGIDEQPILDRYERYVASLEPTQEEKEVRKPWPETGLRHRFLIRGLVAVIGAGLLVFALFLYHQGNRPPSPAEIVASAPSGQEPSAPLSAEAGSSQITVAQDNPTGETAATASPMQAPSVPVTPPQPVADAKTPTPAVPAAKPVKAVTAVSSPAQTADPKEAPVRGASPHPVATPPATNKSGLPPVPAGKKRHLVIEARELTWVRIKEDQNPSYQILLKPGEKIERSAADQFQLDVGNAGGIEVSLDGRRLGKLGEQSQVIHMRLPEKEPGQTP